ncbi:hypothetical protein M2271_007187 [Streptomyces sp. LBL]|uniref:hypothetical protein n=1 Tax=Streptomyces sp. LBL TaxID=2940562 RepID=UPI002474D8B1|nr:hypothetical protein [Streptomyces sp. LBL]MDH6629351.1 hypothetical protein [Streptomyces sp. LBL]
MPTDLVAPYARAAVHAQGNGTPLRWKNVTNVTRTGPGRYTVILASHIDTTTAICQVTADRGANWNTEVYYSVDTTNNNHTVQVLTGTNGAATDNPFHLVVL